MEDKVKKPVGLDTRKKELSEWEDVYAEARDRENRDQDFYDSNQWTAEEVRKIEARGQAVITYNRIRPKINRLLGWEITNRKRPKAIARRPDHEGDADGVTDLLNWIVDYDKFEQKFSDAALDVLVPGIGAIVVKLDRDPPGPESKINSEQVPFNRIFFDPRARKKDASDGRYMGIIAWMHEDEIRAFFPDAEDLEDLLAESKNTVSTLEGTETRFRYYNKTTQEYQVVEHYYKNEKNLWCQCWWLGSGYLEKPAVVPYKDDEDRPFCPMVLCSPFISAGSSEVPERMGAARDMIGPQEEINHRRSKGVHLLNAKEVYYETGALQNPEETRGELLKADPFVEVSRGRLKDGFKVERPGALVDAHVTLMQEAKGEIDQLGPHGVMQGEGGNSKMTGRLFIAQQEVGEMELKPVFDALRQFALAIFYRYLWLGKKIATEETWFNVLDEDDDSAYRLVGINRKMSRGERFQEALDEGTEIDKAARFAFGKDAKKMLRGATKQAQMQLQAMAQQAQAMGQQMPPPKPADQQELVKNLILMQPLSSEVTLKNDVAKANVDLIIETSSNSIIARNEQFTEIAEMMSKQLLPSQDPRMVVALLEASDVRHKRKIIKMLQKPPDEAQVQAQQMAQQAQQMEMQKRIELLAAQVANFTAQAGKAQAVAQLTAAKVQTEPTVGMLHQAQAAKAAAEAQAVGPTTAAQIQKTQIEAQRTAFDAGKASVPGASK